MTVEQIITAVRYCIDEAVSNDSSLANASGNDMASMNAIITSKIGDAVRWICLYGPTELLGGTDEEGHPTGILVDVPAAGESSRTPTPISGTNGGYVTLPKDFIKLARVRVSNWHRAVKNPISEDSDEYLQLYDDNGAAATPDRPQAAIIDKSVRRLEVWPGSSGSGSNISVEYTYVAALEDKDMFFVDQTVSPSVTHYSIPPRAKSAFIYYIAFLLLSAYADPRAERMLEIAKMNLGK